MQKRPKNDVKVTQKQYKNDPKKMLKRPKNDPKTMQKQTCLILPILFGQYKNVQRLIKANFNLINL